MEVVDVSKFPSSTDIGSLIGVCSSTGKNWILGIYIGEERILKFYEKTHSIDEWNIETLKKWMNAYQQSSEGSDERNQVLTGFVQEVRSREESVMLLDKNQGLTIQIFKLKMFDVDVDDMDVFVQNFSLINDLIEGDVVTFQLQNIIYDTIFTDSSRMYVMHVINTHLYRESIFEVAMYDDERGWVRCMKITECNQKYDSGVGLFKQLRSKDEIVKEAKTLYDLNKKFKTSQEFMRKCRIRWNSNSIVCLLS